MIKYLLLINLVWMFSCGRKLVVPASFHALDQVSEAEVFYKFIEVDRDSVQAYHTTISSYGKYFSGITYFKNTSDTSLRVLFTTYTGLKLLDLRIADETCYTMYAMEQLNKPVVLKLLCHDYGLIAGYQKKVTVQEKLENTDHEMLYIQKKEKDLYYFADSLHQEKRAVETVPGKRKIQTEAVMEGDSSLNIQHRNFNFKMGFKKIIKN